MSHVADVKTRCYDLDALADAAALFGGTLRKQSTYRWYGQFLNDWRDGSRAAALRGHDPATFGRCEYALVFPGCSYDVGVVPALDGQGYDLIYDAWSGGHGLEAKLGGAGLPALTHEYAAAATMRQLAREGYVVERGVDEYGNTKLFVNA